MRPSPLLALPPFQSGMISECERRAVVGESEVERERGGSRWLVNVFIGTAFFSYSILIISLNKTKSDVKKRKSTLRVQVENFYFLL